MTNILSVMDKSGVSHQQLYEAVDDRRVELDLTWRELANRAGISTTTLENIRHGRLPRRLTQRRLEDALGWTRGSIGSILRGDEPGLASQQDIDPRTASPEELGEMLENVRDQLVEELGEQDGLDEFARVFQLTMKIRADQRRKRDARTRQDRSASHMPAPNE